MLPRPRKELLSCGLKMTMVPITAIATSTRIMKRVTQSMRDRCFIAILSSMYTSGRIVKRSLGSVSCRPASVGGSAGNSAPPNATRTISVYSNDSGLGCESCYALAAGTPVKRVSHAGDDLAIPQEPAPKSEHLWSGPSNDRKVVCS
jgi:hypothetical protein